MGVARDRLHNHLGMCHDMAICFKFERLFKMINLHSRMDLEPLRSCIYPLKAELPHPTLMLYHSRQQQLFRQQTSSQQTWLIAHPLSLPVWSQLFPVLPNPGFLRISLVPHVQLIFFFFTNHDNKNTQKRLETLIILKSVSQLCLWNPLWFV